MKKMIILSVLLLLLGCSNTANTNINNNNISNNNDTKKEEFIDLFIYLNISEETVKKQELDNKKVYAFDYENDEKIHEYVKKMEENGFILNLFDGTISSTFSLENEMYNIQIIMISNYDEWILNNKEYDIFNILNENIIYTIEIL